MKMYSPFCRSWSLHAWSFNPSISGTRLPTLMSVCPAWWTVLQQSLLSSNPPSLSLRRVDRSNSLPTDREGWNNTLKHAPPLLATPAWKFKYPCIIFGKYLSRNILCLGAWGRVVLQGNNIWKQAPPIPDTHRLPSLSLSLFHFDVTHCVKIQISRHKSLKLHF